MCTGIYIGKKVSADGRCIIARTEDETVSVNPKLFLVEPSETKPGRFMTDTGKDRKPLSYSMPIHTFKYTRVPDAHIEEDGAYASICINEHGLAITATMSLMDINEDFQKLDPLKNVGEGIREACIPDLIACQARSCREALALLGNYMEKVGAEEPGALMLTDKEEAWFYEFYGGHSYIGMRFADDEMAVLGTQVMMGWVDFDDRSGDYVYSSNLKEILDRMPRLVRDSKGRYHIAKTISLAERDPFLSLRVWRGHQLFDPSVSGEFSAKDIYPLCFQPDRLISLEEILAFCGDRFDGSSYDMMLEENKGCFPAGDDYQAHAHVIELIPELPDNCCYIQWLSMGNARYSPFVPAFSGITDTERHYKYDSAANGSEDYSWYDLGKRLWALGKADQKNIGLGLRQYQLDESNQMTEEILSYIPDVAGRYRIGRKEGDTLVTELSQKIAGREYQRQLDLYRKLVYINIRNLADYMEPIPFGADSKQKTDSGKTDL